jgi:hypothetical protein
MILHLLQIFLTDALTFISDSFVPQEKDICCGGTSISIDM